MKSRSPKRRKTLGPHFAAQEKPAKPRRGGRVPSSSTEEVVQTKGDVTRERIRAAVVKLVSKHGLNNVILQDICEEAKITHGGFYFHFSRKEEAMVDVAREWIKNFKMRVVNTPASEDFYDELYGMILNYVEGYIERIEVTRLVYALDPTFEEIKKAFVTYQTLWWDRLQELFERVRRDANLPNGMELCIVHSLTAALEGICVDTYLSRLSMLTATTKSPLQLAERMAVIWHRAVLGRDPDPAKLTSARDEVVAP
jgi:AcrR family transcriptional regulator